jgi:hypothetical protein
VHPASSAVNDYTLPSGGSGHAWPQQQQQQTWHQERTVCQPVNSQLGCVEYQNAAAGVQQQGSFVQALCRGGDATFAQDAAAAAAAGVLRDVAGLDATSPSTPAANMGPMVTPSAPVIELHDLLPVESTSWDCGPAAAAAPVDATGIWDCGPAAAAAPDRLSSDELDALLEHALSDFCAAHSDLDVVLRCDLTPNIAAAADVDDDDDLQSCDDGVAAWAAAAVMQQ